MNFNSLIDKVNSLPKPGSPLEASQIFGQYRSSFQQAPAEEAWKAYEALVQAWGFEFGVTEPEEVPAITRLIQKTQSQDFQSLLAWSQQNRGLFWQYALEDLGLQWKGPAEKHSASAIESNRWFPEARWDLVSLVFSLNSGDSLALRVKNEDGQATDLTFKELEIQTAQWSHQFTSAGFRPGDALGFCAPMNANSLAAFLGAIDAGLILVCIAESFSEQEIQSRLRLSGARGLVFQDAMIRSGRLVDIKAKAINACTSLQILAVELSARLDARPHTLQRQSRSSSDPLLYLFSSGTTGEPKVIPWTSLTPLKSAVDARYHQGFKPGDRIAWPTSWGWMMGPWLLFASFLNRSSLVFFDGAPHHETFLDWIVESRATHLGVVPSLVKAWIHQQSLQKLRESSLEVLSSTGECSNRKDMFILSHACGFRPVIEYCGGTEIGGAYISNHRTHSIAPSTFSGATLGLDFVILDSQQQESDQGEVFLVPPSVGLSEKLLGRDHDAIYYKKAPVHAKGPLRVHGDEMLRVRDGLFRALGRMDDTMNLSGIKVSAVEIERVLHGIPGLQDVAAVARSPEGGGPSQLVLYAVLENPDHKERIEKQAQDRIRTQLNPLFKISKLQGVDSLPRTASNKLMRRLLK